MSDEQAELDAETEAMLDYFETLKTPAGRERDRRWRLRDNPELLGDVIARVLEAK